MKKNLMMGFLAVIVLFHVQPGFSQTAEETKGLIVPEPAPPQFKEAVLSIEGKPFKGNAEAKLTLIEFFDFQ